MDDTVPRAQSARPLSYERRKLTPESSEPNVAEDICTVCSRSAGECRKPLSRLSHSAKMISICSPQCMEAFQREPDRFAADERARPLTDAHNAPMR